VVLLYQILSEFFYAADLEENNPNCQLTAVYISVIVYSYVYCLYEIVCVSSIFNLAKLQIKHVTNTVVS